MSTAKQIFENQNLVITDDIVEIQLYLYMH